MSFEWNPAKAEINLAKHGVSFDEAQVAFDDPLYLVFPDPAHSVGEQRFLLLGESKPGRLLLVAYTERQNVTRLISAREATKRERRMYESEL
jgi:uncharacterized protein